MIECPLVKEAKEKEKKELTDYEAFDNMHEKDGTLTKETKKL